MIGIKQKIEGFIIKWNNKYPLDRFYREKYKIGFNSPHHRSLNQIDIYFEFIEMLLVKKEIEKNKETKERKNRYVEENIILIDQEENLTDEEKENIFKNIKY